MRYPGGKGGAGVYQTIIKGSFQKTDNKAR